MKSISLARLAFLSVGFAVGCGRSDNSEGASSENARLASIDSLDGCQISSADSDTFATALARLEASNGYSGTPARDDQSISLTGTDTHETRSETIPRVASPSIPRCSAAKIQTALGAIERGNVRVEQIAERCLVIPMQQSNPPTSQAGQPDQDLTPSQQNDLRSNGNIVIPCSKLRSAKAPQQANPWNT